MGINAEFVSLVAGLRRSGTLNGDTVIELGAQDVCVVDDVVASILNSSGMPKVARKIACAQDLYAPLGFSHYKAIDASGENGALVFDLNNDLREQYEFTESFDLVTNLGTAEHCFDQRAVFANIHNLCKVGGIMIHALPAQGNVNHAFYNYHPRFFADLATANDYEIIDLSFTVDYKPTTINYSKDNFQNHDSQDILFYATFRRITSQEFRVPFDGMFSSNNKLKGYSASGTDPLMTEFSPYLKGGNWENTKGYTVDKPNSNSPLRALFRHLFGGAK
jgi:SAM-dependent methyltransferase